MKLSELFIFVSSYEKLINVEERNKYSEERDYQNTMTLSRFQYFIDKHGLKSRKDKDPNASLTDSEKDKFLTVLRDHTTEISKSNYNYTRSLIKPYNELCFSFLKKLQENQNIFYQENFSVIEISDEDDNIKEADREELDFHQQDINQTIKASFEDINKNIIELSDDEKGVNNAITPLKYKGYKNSKEKNLVFKLNPNNEELDDFPDITEFDKKHKGKKPFLKRKDHPAYSMEKAEDNNIFKREDFQSSKLEDLLENRTGKPRRGIIESEYYKNNKIFKDQISLRQDVLRIYRRSSNNLNIFGFKKEELENKILDLAEYVFLDLQDEDFVSILNAEKTIHLSGKTLDDAFSKLLSLFPFKDKGRCKGAIDITAAKSAELLLSYMLTLRLCVVSNKNKIGFPVKKFTEEELSKDLDDIVNFSDKLEHDRFAKENKSLCDLKDFISSSNIIENDKKKELHQSLDDLILYNLESDKKEALNQELDTLIREQNAKISISPDDREKKTAYLLTCLKNLMDMDCISFHYDQGRKLADHYTYQERSKAHLTGKKSPFSTWDDPKIFIQNLRKVITDYYDLNLYGEYASSKDKKVKARGHSSIFNNKVHHDGVELRHISKAYETNLMVSQFPPATFFCLTRMLEIKCKLDIPLDRNKKPTGVMLDPCGGWGARAVATFAHPLFNQYTVIEPNENLSEPYSKIHQKIAPHKILRVIPKKDEDVTAEDICSSPNSLAHVAFTSPPYMGLERYPYSSKDTYDIEENWEKFRFHLIKLGMLLRDGGLLVINVAPIHNGAFDLPQQFIDDIKQYASIFQLTLETVFSSVINKKEKSPTGVLDSDVAGREKFIVARKVAMLNKLGGTVFSLNQEPEKQDDQDEACRKFTAVKYDPSFFKPSKYIPAVQPAVIEYRT